jgi:hypothetical protein
MERIKNVQSSQCVMLITISLFHIVFVTNFKTSSRETVESVCVLRVTSTTGNSIKTCWQCWLLFRSASFIYHGGVMNVVDEG